MGGTPILDAKIVIPQPHRHAIERHAARAMLDRGHRSGLALVSAGPGYLSRQLVESWSRLDAGRAVAWLSLDGADDPRRLIAHLVAAVRVVDEHFAADLDVGQLATAGDRWDLAAMDAVIAELGARSTPLCLVLDGVHRVLDPVALGHLESLVRYRPHALRIVVLTQDRTALDLSGPDLVGSVVHVGEALLRFDADQVFRAVASAGLEVTVEQARALHHATGGWPAGVMFATSRAEEHDGFPVFAADEEPVLSYLRHRVASRLEPDLRTFFLRVASLGSVTAELATRITGRQDAGRLLDRLAERHLLQGRADLRPGWLHVPGHLADFARHELRADDDGAATETWRAAARWCWEHELLDESMRISLLDRDPALMGEILLEHHHAWSAGGEAAAVRLWCSVLLQRDPSLVEATLASAWASMFLGDDVAACSSAALLDTTVVPGERGSFVRGELAMIRSYVARRQGRMAESVARARRGVEINESLSDDFETPYRGALPAASALYFGIAAVWGGALSEAIDALEAARADSGWSPRALPAIYGHLSAAHWLLGDDAALAHAEIAHTHLRAELVGPADFSALCMSLVYGVDDGELLPQTLALADAIDEPVAHVFACAAETYQVAFHDRQRALAAVRRARTIVDRCVEPGALRLVVDRMTDHLGAGDGGAVLGDPLTSGEERVLRMLAGSLTEREIAGELNLSHNTVRTYRRRLYRKLGVNSRNEAAAVSRERPSG